MPALADSLSPSTPRCWLQLRSRSPPRSQDPAPAGEGEGRRKGPSGTFSTGGERVKASPEPGRFLPPLPPGKGCKSGSKSQEATMGWS